MERDPFAVIEAMTIAAYATGCERGYLYIRGEYPEAQHALEHALAEARARGLPRRGRDGRGLRVRRRDPPRRGRVHLRRGDGDLRVDRGQARRAAQQAAVPRRGRPLRQADRREQRRDARQRARRRARLGRRRTPRSGTEGSTGTKLFCVSGHVERPGIYEVRFGATLREVLELAGGVAGRPAAPGGPDGRRGGRLPRPGRPRRAAHVRGRARGGDDARLGRRAGARRHRRPAAAAACASPRSSATSRAAQCVPCRVGTVRQEEALARLARRRAARRASRPSSRSSPRSASACATPRSAGSARRRRARSSPPSAGSRVFQEEPA